MNLKEFWGILCKLAHSKSSSVQIGNKGNDYIEVLASFILNLLLLRIKKHLIDLFATLEFEYRPQLYTKDYTEKLITEKTILNYQNKLELNFDTPGLDFIQDYCADWVFKENYS